ncbi:GNAT family N-acetyltransferase [bacterium]|nr:GNAT family N-acetyltransferase [bacterium]
MNIRRAKKQDIKNISKLLINTFNKFLLPYFTKEGAENFKNKKLSTKSLLSRMNQYMFVAEEKEQIIGYIEANLNEIQLFFVNQKYQGKGVGKALMDTIELIVKKKKNNVIYVKASIYAVPIYTNLGFKKTTGKRQINGEQYQPMKKIIN